MLGTTVGPEHMGMRLDSRSAPAAARSIIRAKPAVMNGDPRSLTKTKGDDGLSQILGRFSHLKVIEVPMRRE
jgi:hypothetical protein